MKHYDWNKIATLLHIAEKTSGHPNLKAMRDQALAELEEMCKPEEEPSPEPKPVDDEGGTQTAKTGNIERRV